MSVSTTKPKHRSTCSFHSSVIIAKPDVCRAEELLKDGFTIINEVYQAA
jgi:hypothetical protein